MKKRLMKNVTWFFANCLVDIISFPSKSLVLSSYGTNTVNQQNLSRASLHFEQSLLMIEVILARKMLIWLVISNREASRSSF